MAGKSLAILVANVALPGSAWTVVRPLCNGGGTTELRTAARAGRMHLPGPLGLHHGSFQSGGPVARS